MILQDKASNPSHRPMHLKTMQLLCRLDFIPIRFEMTRAELQAEMTAYTCRRTQALSDS